MKNLPWKKASCHEVQTFNMYQTSFVLFFVLPKFMNI